MADYGRYEQIRKKHYLNDTQVAKLANVSRSTFTDWKMGRSQPKMDKLLKIAAVLGVQVSDLTGESEIEFGGEKYDKVDSKTIDLGGEQTQTSGFYVDADTLSLMQFMADRPQYKVLFKAARDVREEDIAKVKAVLDAFRKDEYAE